MSTYAIGDIQGCFTPLEQLLARIQFDPKKDTLWITGDLVNRGPQSLQVLRFIKNLKNAARLVLGNHDLHLLARAHEAHAGWKEDTLQAILAAPDREELIHWLSQQPLMIVDKTKNFSMVHAGLAYNWDLTTALTLAHEVESVIQDPLTASAFFKAMYGNEPSLWQDDLKGINRLRCITNYLTRARFCHPDGRLALNTKSAAEERDLIPWFRVPNRLTENDQIIFGHWAALAGVTHVPNAIALDTGCVWGFSLTAYRLEDGERFSVSCG